MFSKMGIITTGITAAFLGLFSINAHAVTPAFGVEASAQTLGYPGTYTSNSSNLVGSTFGSALSDPPSHQFYDNLGPVATADTRAESTAAPGHLTASANVVTTGSRMSFSSAAPYGYGYAHFYDVFTVVSDTLPARTPVTITFRNAVSHSWDFFQLYDGYVDMRLSIGAASAMTRWDISYVWPSHSTETPVIKVQTTVGSRLSVDGKLGVFARGFYWDAGPIFGGHMNAAGTADLVIDDITPGASLQADSGAVYPTGPGL